MANIIDQDQQWLLNCLAATLDTNHEVRTFAEASLDQASRQPGFGGALSKVAVNKEFPLGLRQLAAVLLKQYIKKHWQEDEDHFEHPVVSSEEKGVIRRLLLLSLDDSHRKICTAIGMAVASIAQYDWPEEWPDLLPFLMKFVNDQKSTNGVHGVLRCLSLLSSDLDDAVVPTLVPILFPFLHTIVSSPQKYDKSLRAEALSIVHSCTSMLGIMSGVFKSETSALMMPMLKSWIYEFSVILEPPVQSKDPDDWIIRMEVLKCLNQFVHNFPSLTESEFSVVVAPLWQTFVSSLKLYELSSVEGAEDSYQGRYDSDGDEKSLEAFILQLFEFLLTLVSSAKLRKVIARNARELVYYIIAFMQMTEQQFHTWLLDANRYVADEDDGTYSCRVSGALLLEEVVSSCGSEGFDAVVEAAQKRFIESQQEKTAGSAVWWRMQEATLFALASLSEHLLDTQVLGTDRLSMGNLLEQMLAEGLHEYPFLYARAFSACAKFSSIINQRVLEQYLYAAIMAVSLDASPPVKVGACRALCQLLPEANTKILQPHLMGLFSSLTNLLKQASDETLHLILETLQAAVKAGHEASVSLEPIISPVILNLWASHVSDPFISIDAVEVLEAIKNSPGCIRPLVSRILPYVGPIIDKPHQQSDGIVAGSLDLLTMLLKNAPVDVVKAVYDVCFDPVIRIILQSDDHSELQNATQCLAAFVCGAKQDLLSWHGDSGSTMRSLLDAASRLLDPDLESSGSLFVGSYILQLIVHLPSQIMEYIQDLTAALVRRMQSCQIAGLRSSLLVIFARLVHMSSPNVQQFIDLLIRIPAWGYDNSLAYLMSEWTKQQGEIQGAYQIKVTTTALALLLSTRHVELGKINVQGYLTKSTAGIITRSKAKLAPDQWTVMTLPAKILALLADVLIEIQEQVLACNDEDSDWEENQDEDGEAVQDLIYSTVTASHGRPNFEQLDAMAKVFSEKQDETDEGDLLSGSDPLNEINLVVYIKDFLSKFFQNDRPLFDHLCENLTQSQRNAIETLLSW